MTPDEIQASVHSFAEAVTAGDVPAMRDFLADDYFGHEREPGEPSQADRWALLVPEAVKAFADLKVELEDFARDGDVVHIRAVVSGVHTGDLWGSPPTGEPMRLEVPLTLRDTGRGWVVNADAPPTAMLGALRAVGVVPPADEMHLPPRNPIRPPEFLLRLGFTGQAAEKPCSHLADALVFEATSDSCAQCVAAGGFWPALRMCLVCGFTGCCDTSVSKHMHQHYEATGHCIFRSVRLAEGWIWCYEDAAFFERATLERLAAGS
jgi:hypothetical protein